jgi:tetratricopeptide (TPR) repeat protein
MWWIVAAAVVAFLLYRFFASPANQANAACHGALRARAKRDWKSAAKFYDEARRKAERLPVRERAKLQTHVAVQWAAVLYREGRLAEAEKLARSGMTAAARFFAPESSVFVSGHLLGGDLYSDQDRHEEAETEYRAALAGDEKGNDLAGMIFDTQRLADCLLRQNRTADGEQAILQSIELEMRQTRQIAAARKIELEDHQIRPLSAPKLHLCRGEFAEAARLYRDQVEHWGSQAKRPDNIDVGQMRMYLGYAEEGAGRPDEALRAYEDAAAEYARDWCPEHPKAVAARRRKAAIESALTQA